VEITYVYNGRTTQTKVTLGIPGASRDISRGAASGSTSTNSSPTTGMPAPMPTLGNQQPQGNGVPPQYRAAPRSPDAQRIEALEQRMQQLEQKVHDLESHQQPGT
jgi:TolA-binding protein